MSQEISLFTEYHSAENTLTNYCGLILKLLFEEDRKNFEEVIVNLAGEAEGITVNPLFSQQIRKDTSVPDLLITQRSYAIYFETKKSDWFYKDQIERHLESLIKEKKDVNILFMLSTEELHNYSDRFNIVEKKAKEVDIILKAITFEQLINTIEEIQLSSSFKRYLSEFKLFLEKNSYLPSWKYLLDVVNCGDTLNEVNDGFYMCPNSGGPYRHQRAKFFGPYANKQVNRIFEIAGLLIIKQEKADVVIEWNNGDFSDAELKKKAYEKIESWQEWRIKENKSVDLQMFVLEKPIATNFMKDSSGGMFSSKKYFKLIAKDCKTSEELAKKLENKSWSSFEKEN